MVRYRLLKFVAAGFSSAKTIESYDFLFYRQRYRINKRPNVYVKPFGESIRMYVL